MIAWHALTVGMLLAGPAHAQWDLLSSPRTPISQSEITYSCAEQGSAIYLPGCAEREWGIECSFIEDETITTGVVLTGYASAVGMSPKAAYSEHRWWRMWVADEPGVAYEEVPFACRDQSAAGDLNPRILFQPTFPRGCAQPEGVVWLSVQPMGVTANACGIDRTCRAVIYGP